MPLIRARQKAISDLPDWAKCCKEVLKVWKSQEKVIYIVFPDTLHRKGFKCAFCGSIKSDLPAMRARKTGSKRMGTILVPGFDFDEGPGEG